MKLLIIISLLVSCSSAKKTKIYSGIAGGILGGLVGSAIGHSASPNEESDNFNKNLGAAIGLASGAFMGSYLGSQFYKDDPDNIDGPPLKLKYHLKKKADALVPLDRKKQLELSDLKITLDAVEPETYKLEPSKELPKKYQDDVYKQVVIKRKIPTRKIKLKDGKTYILKETELIEHSFVE